MAADEHEPDGEASAGEAGVEGEGGVAGDVEGGRDGPLVEAPRQGLCTLPCPQGSPSLGEEGPVRGVTESGMGGGGCSSVGMRMTSHFSRAAS